MRFVEAFSDSNFYEDQTNIAMFLGLTSIPVVTLLMARHEHAFDFAMGWIALKTFGEIYIVFSFSLIFQKIIDLFPELGGVQILWIYRLLGWSQIACCNIMLLCIIIVFATKAKTRPNEIPPSAFHLDFKQKQEEQ